MPAAAGIGGFQPPGKRLKNKRRRFGRGKEKNMDNMADLVFDKIYEELVFKEDGFVSLNSRIDGMKKEFMEENKGSMTEQQLETLSDSFAEIAAEAQRGGYRLGLKHACRLIFSILAD